MTMPVQKPGKSKQDYSTPQEFIEAVERRFYEKISWDLAADETNAKAQDWYCETINSLIQPWHKLSGLLWLNPPFGSIAPWVKKCIGESLLGARIMLLTPASVGSNWFEVMHGVSYVMYLNPRLSFDGIAPYPKDCMLSYFCHGMRGSEIWHWK